MRKTCSVCGEEFDAKRSNAMTCGDRCRSRRRRRPKTEAVEVAEPVEAPGPPPDEGRRRPLLGVIAQATLIALENAGRMETPLGANALMLAMRLDNLSPLDTGSAIASLSKEYRAALAEAVKDAERESDPLDEIRRSAALKLVARIA